MAAFLSRPQCVNRVPLQCKDAVLPCSRDSHRKHKTVSRPPHLYNGHPYIRRDCLLIAIGPSRLHKASWCSQDHFMRNCSPVNATIPHWWLINIGSCNGLTAKIPYLSKCWPRSRCHHMVSLGHNERIMSWEIHFHLCPRPPILHRIIWYVSACVGLWRVDGSNKSELWCFLCC